MSEQNSTDEKKPDGDKGAEQAKQAQQSEQPATKKVYKKPELRKYTQIDYVTAYGVD